VAAVVFMAATTFAAPRAQAQTITFSPLLGPNSTPFTSLSEAGFTVSALSGAWREGFNFGAPTPSIFSNSAVASVSVTKNGGGLFQLLGFDVGNGGFGTLQFEFRGLNGGNISFAGTLIDGPASGSFMTYDTGVGGLFDEVHITVMRGNTSSYNLDNIRLFTAPVPEPSAISLLGTGLLALAYATSRRRRV
jgi:hypothetical protein